MNPVRFGIVLTYDCNLRCQGCNRYLDVMRVPNSDIGLDDIQEGYNRVVAAIFLMVVVLVLLVLIWLK